jgi:hypothetical protein
MRPGISTRASIRWGCSASTPAPPTGSRTPRSPSTFSRCRCRARHHRPGAVCASRLDRGSGTLGRRGRSRPAWVRDQAGPGHRHARAVVGRWGAGRLVAGDEVYGADPGLRAELEARGLGYVLAVACDHRVVAAGDSYRAEELLRRVPARAWQCLSAGRGAKGHRYYDWAFIRLDHHSHDPSPGGQAGQRWLLVGRNPRTGKLAFYHCWTPRPVSLATLVRSPDAAGPSRSASRPARAWSAWTNSGPPLALLVPVDHPGHARPRLPRGARGRLPHPPPTTSRLISLTCNEVQHLFAALVSVPVGDLEHRRRWSVWRRRHQARARTCHYQRQATRP